MKLKNILKKSSVQTILTSVLCSIVGLFVGFIVLLIINPEHAFNDGIMVVIKSFFGWDDSEKVLAYFGDTLSRTAPLVLAGFGILFAYKAGLFNIGASGQYVIGSMLTLIFALEFKLPWYICLLSGIIGGAFWGAISGALKAFLNVNEVISGIMLNWIGLYIANIILKSSKNIYNMALNETYSIAKKSPISLLPDYGLKELFGYNYINISIFLVLIVAIILFIILNKTTFGYELKATGFNKNAAKYAGMKEKVNVILTLAISGALAGLSGSIFYLSNYELWRYPTSVPSMGFDGIAVAFLGGLDPIGTLVSSFFITYIQYGSSRLSTAFYSPEIGSMVTSVIIYLCAFVSFLKQFINKKINKSGESKGAMKKENK